MRLISKVISWSCFLRSASYFVLPVQFCTAGAKVLHCVGPSTRRPPPNGVAPSTRTWIHTCERSQALSTRCTLYCVVRSLHAWHSTNRASTCSLAAKFVWDQDKTISVHRQNNQTRFVPFVKTIQSHCTTQRNHRKNVHVFHSKCLEVHYSPQGDSNYGDRSRDWI